MAGSILAKPHFFSRQAANCGKSYDKRHFVLSCCISLHYTISDVLFCGVTSNPDSKIVSL